MVQTLAQSTRPVARERVAPDPANRAYTNPILFYLIQRLGRSMDRTEHGRAVRSAAGSGNQEHAHYNLD